MTTTPWALDVPRRVLALLLLIAAVAGVPIGLWQLGAAYLPSALPSWEQVTDALSGPDNGALFLGLLVVIGWAAWAFMTLSLVVETIARLRRVEAPKLPGLGRPQAAAHGLIGLAVLLFIAAPIAAPTPGQAANAGPAAASAPTAVGHVQAGTVDRTPAQRGLDVVATLGIDLEHHRRVRGAQVMPQSGGA